MGLANCRGTLLLAQPTWLVPASSQVSANLRRLGDSEPNTPRPQCGREPPTPHFSSPGHRCLLLRTLRAADQTHPHLSLRRETEAHPEGKVWGGPQPGPQLAPILRCLPSPSQARSPWTLPECRHPLPPESSRSTPFPWHGPHPLPGPLHPLPEMLLSTSRSWEGGLKSLQQGPEAAPFLEGLGTSNALSSCKILAPAP